MIRRPPRSTLSSSSAASDVYKRQPYWSLNTGGRYPSPPMVGYSSGVAVFRCGMGATASLDADSGTPDAPGGQQVLGAHNDVGAGAGGKPAGADCEEARTPGMGDDVTGIGKLGHLSPGHSAALSPFDGAHGGDVFGGARLLAVCP